MPVVRLQMCPHGDLHDLRQGSGQRGPRPSVNCRWLQAAGSLQPEARAGAHPSIPPGPGEVQLLTSQTDQIEETSLCKWIQCHSRSAL